MFVNYLAVYIVLVTVLVVMNPPVIPAMVVFGVTMIWATVGTARTAIRHLLGDFSVGRKVGAILILVVLVVALVFAIGDIRMLFGV